MDEAILHEIFGVSKGYRATRTVVKDGGIFIAVEPAQKLYVCPGCRSRDVIRKGQRSRRVQTLPIGFHPVFLEVAVPRCQCHDCQRIFELAPPFARATPTIPKR